jgi:hypothetical protein
MVMPAGAGSTSSIAQLTSRYSVCRLHCAVQAKSRHPSDALVESWAEWEAWNRYRGLKNDFNRDFIFSLAVIPGQPTQWLFGGVFEVLGRGETFWSKSKPDSEVLDREDYWKRVLLSRRPFGLNAN